MTIRTLARGIAFAMLASNSVNAQLAPPLQFDHTYTGKMIIRHGSPKKVDDMCRVRGQTGPGPWACTYMENLPGECTIWMPNKHAFYDLIFRHERAHCNGWPPSHPLG